MPKRPYDTLLGIAFLPPESYDRLPPKAAFLHPAHPPSVPGIPLKRRSFQNHNGWPPPGRQQQRHPFSSLPDSCFPWLLPPPAGQALLPLTAGGRDGLWRRIQDKDPLLQAPGQGCPPVHPERPGTLPHRALPRSDRISDPLLTCSASCDILPPATKACQRNLSVLSTVKAGGSIAPFSSPGLPHSSCFLRIIPVPFALPLWSASSRPPSFLLLEGPPAFSPVLFQALLAALSRLLSVRTGAGHLGF